MPARVVHLPLDDPELLAGLDRIRDELHVPRAFPADVLAAAKAAAASPRSGATCATSSSSRSIPPAAATSTRRSPRSAGGTATACTTPSPTSRRSCPTAARSTWRRTRRGMTVYLPDARAGLYPPEIAEGSASLLPEQERPALCWTIELDGDGTPTAWRLEPATVRNRRAWSYAEVHAAIDDGTHTGAVRAAARDRHAASGRRTRAWRREPRPPCSGAASDRRLLHARLRRAAARRKLERADLAADRDVRRDDDGRRRRRDLARSAT